jgi:predicted cupin superfamily sugar epimerase
MERFKLEPLEPEGGYFSETYRSERFIAGDALAGGILGPRPLVTAIYYLLTPDTFSAIHRLRSDEIYHFYVGDPVDLLLLREDGSSIFLQMGPNPLDNMRLQVAVPGGTWQGSRLRAGGKFALLGTTVAPGFAPDDYEHGLREDLIRRYPDVRDHIIALTR